MLRQRYVGCQRHLCRRAFHCGLAVRQAAYETRETASENQYINSVGIQCISDGIHRQLFKTRRLEPSKETVEVSRDHLIRHGLWSKKVQRYPEVDFTLPELLGGSLHDHFIKMCGEKPVELVARAQFLAVCELVDPPEEFSLQSGWTRYTPLDDGSHSYSVESVPYPLEGELVFDVEVLYKHSPFAVMATAVSGEAFYAWISPWIMNESDSPRHLIPMGDEPKVILGHNVGYDRARIKEEYRFFEPTHHFIDTMSLHIATYGISNTQRPLYTVMNQLASLFKQLPRDIELRRYFMENRRWAGVSSSMSGLAGLYMFHFGEVLDKSERDFFGEYTKEQVRENIQSLLQYCARDLKPAHEIMQRCLGRFLLNSPHPVTVYSFFKMGSMILPTNHKWNEYLDNAETAYTKSLERIDELLKQVARDVLHEHLPHLREGKTHNGATKETWKSDPWLRQLDWTITPVRFTKAGVPYKRQKLAGYPEWYRELARGKGDDLNLTLKLRVTPLLLKLSWLGYPLRWIEEHGWCFSVDSEEHPNAIEDFVNFKYVQQIDNQYLFKLPHMDGPSARCVSPLGKNYMHYFESEELFSELSVAKEIIDLNMSVTYWTSVRERIRGQMAVWDQDADMDIKCDPEEKLGIILPQTVVMGTVTRRAVEKTWLTASNAKKNRIGSELKAMITAPPGYCFVGADVDSEELWIASLVGDSQFGNHGASALGWMTLEGSKSEGTDMHSSTARILDVSRNDAKVFNYGRIYGAGLQFTKRLLQQKRPILTGAEAARISSELYESTKGRRSRVRPLFKFAYWHGGTESYVFNKLEDLARGRKPRTPILRAALTGTLQSLSVGGGFMTSRTNWAIQSSGVDYLHLLVASMDYMIKTFGLKARLSIAIHDEIRFLVDDKDRYRVALALQICNLWTRAYFCQRLGMHDMPQGVAFFSAIDIDKVLRKEVDLDCVTPSNTTPIPPGESLDINQLLEIPESQLLLNGKSLVRKEFVQTEPDMGTLSSPLYLRLQDAVGEDETRQVLRRVAGGDAKFTITEVTSKQQEEDEEEDDDDDDDAGEELQIDETEEDDLDDYDTDDEEVEAEEEGNEDGEEARNLASNIKEGGRRRQRSNSDTNHRKYYGELSSEEISSFQNELDSLYK